MSHTQQLMSHTQQLTASTTDVTYTTTDCILCNSGQIGSFQNIDYIHIDTINIIINVNNNFIVKIATCNST